MTTGEKIAKLRREKNYTQEQFADILNISRQSVSKWESDLAFPETDKLIKIAEIFDVSIDYLLKEKATIEHKYSKSIFDFHYEYRRKKMIGKKPLVHVNIGLHECQMALFL